MIVSHLYTAPAPNLHNERVRPAAKPRLLLVLTDRTERDELSSHLRPGCELLFAKGHQEAIRMLEAQPPHLVIADSCGDHGLCWYIKNSSRYAHIPVVELIPRDCLTIRLQCLQSGADAWLEKPVSRYFLLAQVDNLLTNRARIREHFGTADTIEASGVTPSVRSDEALWKRINQLIIDHLSNAALDIDLLSRQLFMSRPTLYRKIAEMSNMSPSELITLIRLNNAAVLLASPDHLIGDIARMVGFTTRSGFGKAFQKRFHTTPSVYRQNALGQTPQASRQPGHLAPV